MECSEILNLLWKYDRRDLECDGATRVFSWILKQEEIPHTIKVGRLEYGDHLIEPHYWIELEDGNVVDFKVRMWLPVEVALEAPHGVFNPKTYPMALYIGEEAKLFLVTKTMFEILTRSQR